MPFKNYSKFLKSFFFFSSFSAKECQMSYLLPILAYLVFVVHAMRVLRDAKNESLMFSSIFAFFPIFMFAFFSFCLAQSGIQADSLFIQLLSQGLCFTLCLPFVSFQKNLKADHDHQNIDSKANYSYQAH